MCMRIHTSVGALALLLDCGLPPPPSANLLPSHASLQVGLDSLYGYSISIIAKTREREKETEEHRVSTSIDTRPNSLTALLQSTLLGSTCSSPNPSLIKLSFAETEVPYDLVVVGLLQKPSAA